MHNGVYSLHPYHWDKSRYDLMGRNIPRFRSQPCARHLQRLRPQALYDSLGRQYQTVAKQGPKLEEQDYVNIQYDVEFWMQNRRTADPSNHATSKFLDFMPDLPNKLTSQAVPLWQSKDRRLNGHPNT